MSVGETERRTSGYAIASLVLGIAGFVVFPLVPSILAVVFGQMAKNELRGDSAVGGDGLATAGVILGWVGIAISGLGLLIALFLLLAFL